jgi:putative ABC transport system permease protein
MATLWQDVRYGLRMLAKNPGFTVVVIVILAVGIGATTTMLSVVDAMLLRPPPYENPESLVHLFPDKTGDDSYHDTTSYLNFVDWRDRSTVFEHVAGITTTGYLTAIAEARRERVVGLAVSPEYFALLRVKPVLGRVFLPQEAELGGEPVAIISHRFWQSWFGGDTDVLGKSLVLDQKVYTVVGVMAADFRYADRGERDVWLPLLPFLGPTSLADRGNCYMCAMGRLEDGVTVAQAQAEMSLIGQRLAQAYPEANAGTTVRVIPVTQQYNAENGRTRQTLLIAQGIVTFVLLIACFHVAGLLLMRSAQREQEIAVRAALGARRRRLIAQLLTEGVLLSSIGGALGLLLAYWGLGLVGALRSTSSSWLLAQHIQKLIPWFIDFRIDARAVAYVTAVSLSTCGVFGILPAVLASQVNLHRSLSTGRMPGQGLRFARTRLALVVLDIAIAFVLLTGAGLLVNSFARLNSGLGYEPDRVLTADIDLDYSQAEKRLAFYEQALERLRSLPGVEFVAVSDQSPAWGGGNFARFHIEGYSLGQVNDTDDDVGVPGIRWRPISPDYFRALGIPLLKGRHFTDQDRAGSTPVIIISDSMARRFWPNRNPVGTYLTEMRETRTKEGDTTVTPLSYLIVGVVGDAKHFTWFKGGPPDPETYVPYLQAGYGWGLFVLRTHSDPRGIMKALRSELLAVDSGITIGKIIPLEDEIAGHVSPQRFNMLFLSVFAVVALALAATGIYGVTAYAVSRRTHEIGIRMALGARGNDVMGMVLRHGLRLTAVGLATGGAWALAATRIIRSLLYDVSPTDPLTFAATALLLTAVALLACYVPARRAARVDPMVALRYE